jgi:hypothetical protein
LVRVVVKCLEEEIAFAAKHSVKTALSVPSKSVPLSQGLPSHRTATQTAPMLASTGIDSSSPPLPIRPCSQRRNSKSDDSRRDYGCWPNILLMEVGHFEVRFVRLPACRRPNALSREIRVVGLIPRSSAAPSGP